MRPIYFLFLIFLLSSCASIVSIRTIYDQGDYELVIDHLHNKALKGIMKEKEVQWMQTSIERVLFKKKFELTLKSNSESFIALKRAYVSLDEVEKIQSRLESYIQLDKNYLGLIDIEKWDKIFSDKLYKYHAEKFETHKDEYLKSKNQNHLINAHSELAKMAHFKQEETNIDSLMQLFKKYGKRNIKIEYVESEDHSEELSRMINYIRPENSMWTSFGEFANPDFTIKISLNYIDTSCKAVAEEETKVVNEMVDLENDGITKTYVATVNDVLLLYAARANVNVDIYWNDEEEPISTRTFSKSSFVETWKTYFVDGDRASYFKDPNTNKGSIFMDSKDFDYSDLIRGTIENVSEDIEDYLESY